MGLHFVLCEKQVTTFVYQIKFNIVKNDQGIVAKSKFLKYQTKISLSNGEIIVQLFDLT